MALKRVFLALLLLTLVLGQWPLGDGPAQAQSPCDPTAYVGQLLADVGRADAALRALPNSTASAASTAYWQISGIRRQYEDARNVPPCAVVLHSLIGQWFAAAGDKAALYISLAGDAANASTYTARIAELDGRMNALAQAANNELQRLQGVAAAPTPAPASPGNVAAPATPPNEDWYRVFFTNPINSRNTADHTGGASEQALIFVIDRTERTIDGALFELNAPDTTAALLRALGRGVRVRLVADDEHNFDDPESTIRQLTAAGAQVVSDRRAALMHSKFLIFDGITVWTGSTNLTRNDLYNNNNNAIFIRDAGLAANYQAEFEEMFTDGRYSRSDNPRPTPNPVLMIGGTRVETYFSPEDGAAIERRIVELINGARSSVEFMTFSFTLAPIGEALIAARGRGVAISGVSETTGSLRGQLRPLACAGLDVRQDGNPNILHHKVFIIDKQIVVMGSFNFSSNARDQNTENLLILFNPNIAALYQQEFQKVYALGRVPSATDLRCGA
jgi:phosphatidylserine/phosphatidylglycerophosphate/cardiolipin synthase-like enzyme